MKEEYLRETLHELRGNVSKLSRTLGIDYLEAKRMFATAPVDLVVRPIDPMPDDIRILGRNGWKQFVVAVKEHGSEWPIQFREALNDARRKFDAGTHIMCQEKRKDGWIVQYLVPRKEPLPVQSTILQPAVGIRLTILDLATSMSRINRWAGCGAFALSIAQHSVLLALMVPTRLRRAALIHDCSEVFLGGDVISPIKDRCPDLQNEEETLQRRLFSMLNVPFSEMLEVHPFDVRIRFDESAALFPDDPVMLENKHRGLDVPVEPMLPHEAAEVWLRFFMLLFMGEFLQ